MAYGYPISAFLLCVLLTMIVRKVSFSKGWSSTITEERWGKSTVPLGGGIAIFISMTIPLLFLVDYSSFLTINPFLQANRSNWPFLETMLPGAVLAFTIGLLDDFININPHSKLLGQILAASFAVLVGFRLHWFTSVTIDTMITIFWIVGITNSFNLIDNMDGLCAGTGAICAVFLGLIFLPLQPITACTAFTLAAALIGFLIYNFKPASIFMGDSGSLLTGFVLSVICLQYTEIKAENTIAKFAVPILVMMIPIFDTTLVSTVRLLSGRKATRGGKDHTSHRLVLIGMSERSAVLAIYGITFLACTSAILVDHIDSISSAAVIIPILVSIVLFGAYISQLRIYRKKEFSVLMNRSFTPILIDLTYKKHILLVLLDLLLISFSYYLSFRLKFEPKEFVDNFHFFLQILPVVIICKFIMLFYSGVYRGIWRHMSTKDIQVHLKASLFATGMVFIVVLCLYDNLRFPLILLVIDFLVFTAFLLGSRGSFKLFDDFTKRNSVSGESVLIYGAGGGGEILLRELLNNHGLKLKPVGFIDDDWLKTGKKLFGYSIFGTSKEIDAIIKSQKPSGIIVSFRIQSQSNLQKVIRACKQNKIFLKQFSIHLNGIENVGDEG